MTQVVWEQAVYWFGYMPLCAAVYHPIETFTALVSLTGLAIWSEF